MFDLYENIKGLCEARGVSVSKMCVDIGVSKSLMSNIKNHRANTLSAKSVAKIAEYLGVSYDCVMHGQKEKSPPLSFRSEDVDFDVESIVNQIDGGLSEKDMRLLAWFRSLPVEKQKAILTAQDAPTGLV